MADESSGAATSAQVPPWLALARSDLKRSTSEVPGPGTSPFIAGLYRTLRLPVAEDSSNPWCAVYACATLVRSGLRPWRRLRAARGALDWGDEIPWSATLIRPGAIVVLDRVDPKHPTEKHGHVGFATHMADGRVWLVSGNSHNRVAASDYDPGRIIGVRWPKRSDYLVDVGAAP